MTVTIDICVEMTQKTCIARHVFDFYFIVTFCKYMLTLTLTLCKYALRTHAASLGECDLFAALLTDPRAQEVKKLYSDL